MTKYKDWGYRMNDDDMDNILRTLSKAYQDTYYEKEWDVMDDSEELKPASRFDAEWVLRDVMHELHKQGEGLDTLLALKNDQLREWWNKELAKIKREEAKRAAREKAKSLLSEEERKLLGMKF